MPDLDQLIRALVDDVVVGTRPPGASRAIARAQRRRIAGAALVAVVVVAAGSGLTVATLGGGDDRSSVAASAHPSTTPSVFQEDAGVEGAAFRNQLRTALAGAPGLAVTEHLDPTVLHPCAGDWSVGATGGSGGTISLSGGARGPKVFSDGIGFPSEEQAARAVALLVRNLEACKAVSWTAAPVGGTGAVLATTANAVVWIHRYGDRVSTLQVPTTDGPPSFAVQVEVAGLIYSFMQQRPVASATPPAPHPT